MILRSLSATLFLLAGNTALAAADFAQDVRPILAKHCFACHGPDKQKGGLRLDRKADAFQGGDSGPAITPGNSAESLLVQLISGQDADRLMPPKGDKLTAEEIRVIRAWIDAGTEWPDDGSKAADPRDWWSLRPLVRPAVPTVDEPIRNPIDAFIRAKLREKGLAPSAEADRRTLIRRLTFDLTGLPPSPDAIDAFIADPSTDAYERLVDRLLESPAYGERWARHWLDVVHYGDTHGYDKDKPRPNAWPYRDYVIRSFNADKPYDRFVQEQIAGDGLFPGTRDGVEALGFIAAGPWDSIGHIEVPESKIDGQIARHLDRDDMVANTINTFLSLTVQCAQCHNHKFDPITQEDYYSLHAVFAALDRADKPYYADPARARQAQEWQARQRDAQRRKEATEARMARALGTKLAELDRQIVAAGQPKSTPPEHGYHSGLANSADVVKWVQVDLGKSSVLDRVVLTGCFDAFGNIGAGFGFPVRFKIELSDDPAFRDGVVLLADRTAADEPNPGVVPQAFLAQGKTGRYVRVTATRLAKRVDAFILALAELQAFDQSGANVAAGQPVAALDSIEAGPRWRKANLTDEIAPSTDNSAEWARLREERRKLLDTVDKSTQRELADATGSLAAIEAELRKLTPDGVVYAGTVYHGSGAFAGTGATGGKPRVIRVLARGDVRKPGKEVVPGAIAVLETGSSPRFALPPDHPEGDRRAALAAWLTSDRNPLVWRSVVNRVWRWHFGRGIVETPNDFGRMGMLPSHPELLDWLAAEFRDNGKSFKRLHRLIVTSATYRQVSASRPDGETQDADNALFWRATRRRLEAEEVRDAMLAVAGTLDPRMGGPGYQDFVIEKPEHSPHYQYHLFDSDDPKARRRSVYRFLVRSQQQPFMTVLDCADPSMQVDRRNETVSPLQALALLNNGFTLAQAKHFARWLETFDGEDSDRIAAAMKRALGRQATAAERETLAEYARQHGWANACRLIFNMNEFVFVD